MTDGVGTQAAGAVSDRVAHLKQATAEYYQKAKDKAVELKEGSEEFIRERPIRVTLAAATLGVAVGFLVGYLVGGRRD